MVLKDFDKNLEKYASLLISTGINVQPGHTVNIVIDVDQAPLARLLSKRSLRTRSKRSNRIMGMTIS